MHHISEMLKTHPVYRKEDNEYLSEVVESCLRCAAVCRICADACLSEDKVAPLVQCIKLNVECANVCQTTANLLVESGTVGGQVELHQLQACLNIVQACAEECARHAPMHEHCQVCEESCRKCIDACRQYLSKFEVAA